MLSYWVLKKCKDYVVPLLKGKDYAAPLHKCKDRFAKLLPKIQLHISCIRLSIVAECWNFKICACFLFTLISALKTLQSKSYYLKLFVQPNSRISRNFLVVSNYLKFVIRKKILILINFSLM